MLKELIIAIVLGAIIGFGATSGIISLKNRNNPSQLSPSPTPLLNDQQPTVKPNQHLLTIQQPNNETVVDQDTVDIIGQTTANSQVVVHSQTNSFFLEADQDGQFEQSVNLEGGANLIQISAISPDEQQADFDLIVTYSTADF